MVKDVEKACQSNQSSGSEDPLTVEPLTITIELDENSYEEPLTEANPPQVSPLHRNSTEFVIVSATSMDRGNKMCADSESKEELVLPNSDAVVSQDVLENDPMGILTELNDGSSTNSSRSNDDHEEITDDCSTGSSSAQTISSSTNILEWCKEYPWLLYEEGDEMYGYCLYCDAKLNIRSLNSVKQHGISLYHKERSGNYLAFREEEERNNLG